MRLLDQRNPRSVEAISERLELTRMALDMTQAAFAADAGLQPTAYANWKKATGRPDLDSAFALSDAHGLTIEWIYEGDAGRLPGRVLEAIREFINSGRAA
jgi:transcriptional regulator with XRE-family HTH domain